MVTVTIHSSTMDPMGYGIYKYQGTGNIGDIKPEEFPIKPEDQTTRL